MFALVLGGERRRCRSERPSGPGTGRRSCRSPPDSARSPSATCRSVCSRARVCRRTRRARHAAARQRARAARRRDGAGGQRRRRRDGALAGRRGSVVRAQMTQERRLVARSDRDRQRAARASAGRRGSRRLRTRTSTVADPVQRLRVLAALTSNVSLNAARTIAVAHGSQHQRPDHAPGGPRRLRACSRPCCSRWALIVATRRQTAHFRSLVTSSTDLVLVFGARRMPLRQRVGRRRCSAGPRRSCWAPGSCEFVHPDDRAPVQAACADGEPHEIVFLLSNRFGEWRHLEAHVTDLRGDRQIRGVVFNARDITERVRLEEELSHQAFHDGLTGLANRSLFHDRLDQALVRSARSHDPLAVLLVDLDRFKQVNDTPRSRQRRPAAPTDRAAFRRASHGRATRSRVSAATSSRCCSKVRAKSAGVAIAARLHRAARASRCASPGASSCSTPASASQSTPGGPGTGEELVRHADVAMYAAKRSGGGHYEVFRPEMAHELGELLGLEHELRQGLQRGEFSVHYQPEIDLATDAIVGVEALVRWYSPTRGVVMPGPVHSRRRGDRADRAARRVRAAARRAGKRRSGGATASSPRPSSRG